MKKFFSSAKNILILILVVVILAEGGLCVFFALNQNQGATVTGRQPNANVRGKVLTDLGEMICANIIVEDSEGKSNLYTTNLMSTYDISLSEGTYTFHYTRGMQFSTVTKTVTVEKYKDYYLEDVRLIRLYDSESKGFYPGDLHQHTYFSDGSDSPHQLLLADIAAGLTWALLTDHNDNRGMSEWLQNNRAVYDVVDGGFKFFTPIAGVEITTGYGHFQSIGVSTVIDEWDIDLDLGENPYEQVKIILEEMRRAGAAIVQLNHPYSTGGMGFNNYTGLWDFIDMFDTMEIWNGYFEPCGYIPAAGKFNQNRQSMLTWFDYLNQGKKIFATAGTDIHSIKGYFNPNLYAAYDKAYEKALKQAGQYAGMPTCFAYIPDGNVNADSILQAMKQGNSFITNGPLVFATVNGKTYGQTAYISSGTVVDAELFCREGLETLNIYKNGEIIKTISLEGQNYNGQFSLEGIEEGDWIVIEVYGEGVYYAVTNPIFFE